MTDVCRANTLGPTVGDAPCASGSDAGFAVVVLAALAGFAYMLIAPLTLMDGDTGWHLATGAWILEHARVPTTDPFSYTAHGRAWVAHEWLSEIAMVAAWRAGGWSGLIVLFGAALAALLAIVGLHLRRSMRPGATLLALALIGCALSPSLIGRPHMLAWPILAAWVAMLLRAREQARGPRLGWAALMLLWANAHASFMLGLGLAAVFALDALVATRAWRRVAADWVPFGLLAGAAALLTPAGVHGLLYPFQVSGLALLPYIAEWRPADFARVSPFELALLAGLFCVLARPIRIAPVRLLLLIGLLHMALAHMRYGSVFAIVAALVLAGPLGRAWSGRRMAAPLRFGAEQRALAGIAAALALGLAAYRIALPIVRADSPGVPATALRHLPAGADRVFNEYSFGGSLILSGVRPYIDGRSDMYGDAFTIDYFRIAKGDRARFQAADARWRFGWTMLPPANPLVAMLDRDPAWRRSYADDIAVIHVRRD